ncbi:MAG TPA: DegT/DnrJ/EryC1/StrS family aminotransferase [Candidatus Methylacidiphilales bacterium]|nr:DegT/DnrJ/EryC1/StrS family aminotransferase [Candidatus Methylacidiphilales bacterium]
MKVPFVDLKAAYYSQKEEIDQAVAGVLERTDFILGESVAAFEKEFAAFCEAPRAVGVGSGLEAIKLGLRACGIGPGDEVICPAHTFIATLFGISGVGARPRLVDADDESCNINPELIEAAITPRTKAILPVHLYGRPAEMEKIMEIARRHGLLVGEDAAQAHGARYRGRRVGGFGRFAAFSLYPAKNLGAYGDGGLLVTGDAALADKVSALRNYGSAAKYHHIEMGENSRLDTLQAVICRVKLKRLDETNRLRQLAADLYREKLSDIEGLCLPAQPKNSDHVYHLFVVRTARRDKLVAHLQKNDIGCVVHYPIPCHLQPCYKDLGYAEGDFPVTERICREVLSLPLYPEISKPQVEAVAGVVRDFFLKTS